MTRREAMALGLRVLGLALLFATLLDVPGVAESRQMRVLWQIGHPTWLNVAWLSGWLVQAIAAATLLLASRPLAWLLVWRDQSLSAPGLPADWQGEVRQVAARLFGLLLLVVAVPGVVHAAVQAWQQGQTGSLYIYADYAALLAVVAVVLMRVRRASMKAGTEGPAGRS